MVWQNRRAAGEVSKWGWSSRRDIRCNIGAGDRAVAETGRERRRVCAVRVGGVVLLGLGVGQVCQGMIALLRMERVV